MHVSDHLAVVVTGATGFIGRHVIGRLLERNVTCRVLVRNEATLKTAGFFSSHDTSPCKLEIMSGDLTEPRSLHHLCDGMDAVIHVAGYAHAEDADSPHAASRHRQVTVEGTRALLAEAVRAGVRSFIFVSSVKAMGEGGPARLDENSPAEPASAYGRAKLEAERLVLAAGREHGLHTCVLRLPLVYGPGNLGNLRNMISAISHGRFPPLPKMENKRSMVHVDDVVRALLLVADRPNANGQIYIVTDGRVYSTYGIYSAICRALGRKVPDWSVPTWVLYLGARTGDALGTVLGRRMPLNSSALEKLLGSAWHSSDKIRRELGFAPRHTLYDALPEIIAEYRAEQAKQVERHAGV